MTNFEPAPDRVAYSSPDHALAELTPVDRTSPLADVECREQRRWVRTRVSRISCTIVTISCGLFAVVLAAHILMVLGEVNPANGVASFVRGFAAAVSFGLDGLFTPTNPKIQVLFNDGLAALVWLGLAAVVTVVIRRFALPGPIRPLRGYLVATKRDW